MKVFARRSLASSQHTGDHRLLLEGDWGGEVVSNAWSLDRTIDGERSWIDAEASRLAAMVENASAPDSEMPTAGYMNALRLRYFMVKLLRVVTFFDEVARLPAGSEVHLHIQSPRDNDYITLFEAMAHAKSWKLVIHRGRSAEAVNRFAPAENTAWRRIAANSDRLANGLFQARCGGPRVALCGNPRVLDPLCAALVRRDVQVTWIYEHWAARHWLKWRRRGVRQWTCAGTRNTSFENLPHAIPNSIEFRGVRLYAVIHSWLARRSEESGETQARWIRSIQRHLEKSRLAAVVLDQDATPFARAVVFAAQKAGIETSVVQHGAPAIRFGFAPLAADRFIAWGDSTRDQLQSWGTAADRIQCSGHVGQESLRVSLNNARRNYQASHSPNVVLLATTPARDDRPDAVTYHLTTETHREMLRTAFAAAAKIPGAKLTVKLHPRGSILTEVEQLCREYASLDVNIVREASLSVCVADAACVLSCGSTAGIEALWSGVPVIQLAPLGSRDYLARDAWGMLGVARTERELDELLAGALAMSEHRVDLRPIFGDSKSPAEDIANEILVRAAAPA